MSPQLNVQLGGQVVLEEVVTSVTRKGVCTSPSDSSLHSLLSGYHGLIIFFSALLFLHVNHGLKP